MPRHVWDVMDAAGGLVGRRILASSRQDAEYVASSLGPRYAASIATTQRPFIGPAYCFGCFERFLTFESARSHHDSTAHPVVFYVPVDGHERV